MNRKNEPGGGRLLITSILLGGLLAPGRMALAVDFAVRMQTDMGAVDLLMFDTAKHDTVTNFMNYADRGDYDNSVFHRYADVPFILQGGGYTIAPGASSFIFGSVNIPEDPPILNEPGIANTIGTLAMAKKQGDANSATSEWFFNLGDNPALDDPLNNGGYTVFAEVTGGLEVLEQIGQFGAALTCEDTVPPIPFGSLCFSFAQLPLLPEDPQVYRNNTIFNVLAVGRDDDGDGAVDRVEDLAHSGSGNGDMIDDSLQQHVASYLSDQDLDVTVFVPDTMLISDFSTYGWTFAHANRPAFEEFLRILVDAGAFEHGFAGYQVGGAGLAPGGSVDVRIQLLPGSEPDSFYVFGPEPGNNVPHWYEFSFDGTTGAEYDHSTGIVTLHLVDGLRGDADLDATNGVISVSPGAPVDALDVDLDGVDPVIENLNGGDANGDNIPDSLQGNVATFPDANGLLVTLESVLPQSLHYVDSFGQQDFFPPEALQAGAPGLDALTGYTFRNGFFTALIHHVTPGMSAQVTLTLPDGHTAESYFVYGPTPGNPTPHWYPFMYDPASGTGAQITVNPVSGRTEVILNFVDGQRGDSDLAANGVIVDPGGPATKISAPGGGGGGCSVYRAGTHAWQGGAWWLMGGWLLLVGCRRLLRSSCRTGLNRAGCFPPALNRLAVDPDLPRAGCQVRST